MKIIQSTVNVIKKISKGMVILVTLNIFSVLCVTIFDACKKAENPSKEVSLEARKFTSALEAYKKEIGSAMLSNKRSSKSMNSKSADLQGETIYLNFSGEPGPVATNMFNNLNTIQDLSDLVGYSDAVVQYTSNPSNINYQITVSESQVVSSLAPLIEEAKQYLYAKGFTNQDIQDMLIEEQGREEDLVPFVMTLTHIESGESFVASNYTGLFINSSYAYEYSDYMECALVAIGADVLWSLSTSEASSWSRPMMKKAFGAVAKRMLGPIGAAIAVVSFGLCMAQQ